MNYYFPHITNINDVLPFIEGRDEFRVMKKDWYTAVNYAVAFEDTFQWDDNDYGGSVVRRECRGLIFDTATGNLISRPYHKFFNAGEKDETQLDKINLHEPHVVLEKLDGSMIRPIPTPEGFVLATKAGVTDIAQQAEKFISDNWIPTNELYKPYHMFINLCISQETTPIFEWCSRKNRIVIDYPEDQLILTGIRYNNTGAYVEYESMKNSASHFNIPVVKAIAGGDDNDIQKIVDHIRKWDDGEGVVIRFDSGHMLKIKADDYVLRHKSKESINQEKNVIQLVLNDAVDDMIPLLTKEDAERLKNFQKAFWDSVTHTVMDMNDLYNAGSTMYPDQKDFAVNFVQKMILPFHAPIMYAIRGGRPTMEVITEMIRKSLTSQTKVNDNRWLWGNLDWNYSNVNAGE
ncbi:MAG: T4 RnlA family RNA ligase [Candidatus Nanopelagicaceae bacterium]